MKAIVLSLTDDDAFFAIITEVLKGAIFVPHLMIIYLD